jgi:hypothetical protein
MWSGGDTTVHIGVTKQHVIGDRMRKIIPALTAVGHQGLREASRYTKLPGIRSLPPKVEIDRRPGSIVNWQLKVACEACNIGWMRLLEEAAYPFIEKLILGESFELSKADQTLVTRWISQVWLVSQYMKNDWVITPQEQRVLFRQQHLPPAGCQIWIGNYAGSHYMGQAFGVSSTTESWNSKTATPKDEPPFAAAAFCCWLGHFFIHVVFSSDAKRFHVKAGKGFTEIFPPTDERISWPTDGWLDGDVYDFLVGLRSAFGVAPDWMPWLVPDFLAPR